MRYSLSPKAALLLAGLLTFVMMGAGQSLYGPSLPVFSRLFGLSLAEAGTIVSAQWIGSACGVAAMILTRGRLGPRVALALMAAGATALALQAAWGLMLAASVIFGAGYGISASVFNPRVMRAFGARGPAMVSLLNAMFAAGAILAPLAFVAIGSDPRLAFATVAALCALIALASGREGDPAQEAAAHASQPYRFGGLSLGFVLFGVAAEACLIGLGPAALVRAGLAEVTAARLLSAFFVAFLIGRIVLVFVNTLVPPFAVYIGAMILTAACMFAGSVLPPGPFYVLTGLSAGCFFPTAYVMATRVMGDHANVAPTILSAGLAGGITSPLLAGWAMAALGDRGFFVVLAVFATLVTLGALALRRRLAA